MTGPNDSRIVKSSERPSSIGSAFTTTSRASSSWSSPSSAKAGRIVSKSVSEESRPSGNVTSLELPLDLVALGGDLGDVSRLDLLAEERVGNVEPALAVRDEGR